MANPFWSEIDRSAAAVRATLAAIRAADIEKINAEHKHRGAHIAYETAVREYKNAIASFAPIPPQDHDWNKYEKLFIEIESEYGPSDD